MDYDYIELECPSCGGHVRSDRESRKCICQYCGAELMVFFDEDKEIYKLIPYVAKEVVVEREVIIGKIVDERKITEEEERRKRISELVGSIYLALVILCFCYILINIAQVNLKSARANREQEKEAGRPKTEHQIQQKEVEVTLENNQEFPGKALFLLLPQLEELYIDVDGFSLYDIAENKTLTKFCWESENKPEDSAGQVMSVFSGSQLEELQLSWANEDELYAIGKLPQLSSLTIACYMGETLEPITQLENLTTLDITGSREGEGKEMVGVEAFYTNTTLQAGLKTLRLKNMNLKNLNLKFIDDFQVLEIMDLSGSAFILSDLKSISSESLKILNINTTEFGEDSFDSYMGFVAGVPNLEELYLRKRRITNLEFVKMLPKLRVIEIPGGIEDKTPLEKLPDLIHIIEGESPTDLP